MESYDTNKRLMVYCQVMIVLLALIAVRVWMSPAEMLPAAQAQFMDSGAQRQQIVKTGERTNELLSEIHSTLKGTLTVRLDESKAGATRKEATPKGKTPGAGGQP